MTVHKWLVVVGLVAGGFGTAVASTIVGHPVPTEAAVGDGLTFTEGALAVSSVVYDHCDDPDETVDFDEVIDPVANDTVLLTVGDHCRVRIYLSERADLAGTGPSGSSFALDLGVGWIDLEFDPPVTVPSNGSSGGTGILLAYEDWVTAEALDLDPNEHVVVDANHGLHNTLRNAIRNQSTAW